MQVPTKDKRYELLSHSLLKSYQTQASAHGSGTDLTVGLLVPHVSTFCCDYRTVSTSRLAALSGGKAGRNDLNMPHVVTPSILIILLYIFIYHI